MYYWGLSWWIYNGSCSCFQRHSDTFKAGASLYGVSACSYIQFLDLSLSTHCIRNCKFSSRMIFFPFFFGPKKMEKHDPFFNLSILMLLLPGAGNTSFRRLISLIFLNDINSILLKLHVDLSFYQSPVL